MQVSYESRGLSCDTLVVAPGASGSGRTLFAKNSDRHPNEAQYLELVPAADHVEGETVQCTYISIPQVRHTYRVWGSQPWWIWGFEHGINEHGVIIGNEALWSKLPARFGAGLLGMDLLRLTLERSRTAGEALRVLTRLIEEHGQSGPTSPVVGQSYDNGFVIADTEEAWLVQTADRHWAAQRVETVGSMSNLYTIGADCTLVSEDAVREATERGWYDPESGQAFDFARAFGDTSIPFLGGCARRFERSSSLLSRLHETSRGALTLEDLHGVLSDLGTTIAEGARPGERSEGAICMFAEDSNGSRTVATIVAELDEDPASRVIGVSPSAPLLSGLIPIWTDLDHPGIWRRPESATGCAPGAGDLREPGGGRRGGSSGEADAGEDLWWTVDLLQRRVEQAFPAYAPVASAAFRQLNRSFFGLAGSRSGVSAERRAALCGNAEQRVREVVGALHHLLDAMGPETVLAGDGDARGDYLGQLDALSEATTGDRIAEVRTRVLANGAAGSRATLLGSDED